LARRKLQKRTFSDIDRGSFGGLVFNARKKQGLTQAELAEMIKRDRPWLSDVETGKITHVLDDDIDNLARTLSLDPSQLRGARARSRSRAIPDQNWATVRQSCQVCSCPNPNDANFCSSCGSKLRSDVECPTCRHRNEAIANFCNNCGDALLALPEH
jgi:hypothetical protein